LTERSIVELDFYKKSITVFTMNPELISLIALWLGYITLFGLALAAIGGLYLVLYVMGETILKRLFLPVWGYHAMKAAISIACSRTKEKNVYILYLFKVLGHHERKYPELRGLVLDYAKEIVEADNQRKQCDEACASHVGNNL
jgi:hypothetical protein